MQWCIATVYRDPVSTFECCVQLSVVGVAVVLDAKTLDEATHEGNIHCKKYRTEH